jgi:hypothetical protein
VFGTHFADIPKELTITQRAVPYLILNSIIIETKRKQAEGGERLPLRCSRQALSAAVKSCYYYTHYYKI